VTATVEAGTPRKAAQKGASSAWSWARRRSSSLSDALHGVHRAAALETRAAACNKRRPPDLNDTILKGRNRKWENERRERVTVRTRRENLRRAKACRAKEREDEKSFKRGV